MAEWSKAIVLKTIVPLGTIGSNPITSSMNTFELKNGQIVCKKCGSKNVSIKAGMMVDRAWCNDCNNEDYI